ncbi:hypothetical protein AVEN_212214-1 [Araneus ventricosus]|uniref:Secreted protein n=1 Tax=Araneus ventricosus TaxID=182803 RepID=A0A4Y2T8D1_ARAVE|nr:hypothetical protein AVEN_212214-1 [Araneus ventricosus]
MTVALTVLVFLELSKCVTSEGPGPCFRPKVAKLYGSFICVIYRTELLDRAAENRPDFVINAKLRAHAKRDVSILQHFKRRIIALSLSLIAVVSKHKCWHKQNTNFFIRIQCLETRVHI